MPISTAKLVIGAHGPGEDRAEVTPFGDGLVLIIADGAGGTRGGAEAAGAVVQ